MRHAVIMAGGAGVRLWPLSRHSRPKQTLRMFDGSSLLRQAYERIRGLFPDERIHVIANDAHVPLIRREIPELGPLNVIGEPMGRDTANAVGLATSILKGRDSQAVVGIFTADHIITPTEQFHADINKAFDVAERHPDALITLGVRPSRADTNYGYIRRGTRLDNGVFEVEQFTEKPNMSSAMKYVAAGEYYWNSGMFVWKADTILEQLRKNMPQSHTAITSIAEAWGTRDQTAKLAATYPTLMRISIDFAVMEHADRVIVVELECHWVDVGSWPAIEAVIQADADGNVSACEQVIHLGSRGNIVVSGEKHLIATIGVDDLVIVHSPDATLICTKRDAQGIKELVDNVRQRYGEEYL
ncbi:MAG: mannose-1-phosphate guanylyltransferase [Planctomycetota bacterium]